MVRYDICHFLFMNLLMKHKIAFGYIILLIVIAVAAFTVINEHIRLNKFKKDISVLLDVQREISIVHRRITTLATFGESVIIWSNKDYGKYSEYRERTDSLLLSLRETCHEYLCPNQIDTLRLLLEYKADYLYKLMTILQDQERADSLWQDKIPDIMNNAFEVRKVTRKKKGLAGIFGKKETIFIPCKSYAFSKFNDSIASYHLQQNTQVTVYADSLRMQNRQLNRKWYELINHIDNQVQSVFLKQGEEMIDDHKASYHVFVFVLVVVLLLLVISFCVIQYDLYKEEKIKKKLEQTVCENEELLNMRNRVILAVSHDIKGPIGNIHNCADLASSTPEAQAREIYLKDIRCSCHHIVHLVNNLMDAYRINEVRVTRNDAPFNLNDFLNRITSDFSRKANSKPLFFHSLHKNPNLTLLGDVDKLEQVLSNLLTNAIKFTPSGSIHFRTDYKEGRLYVEISDTGIGMDFDTQKIIFQPFERAAQNVSSEGFGLGLYLTKGLVKVLDGTLDFSSVLGNGTTFKLEFPFPETSVAIEDKTSEEGIPFQLPNKILVIDDDQILLKVTKDMLGRNGVQCTVCTTAQELMDNFEKNEYDLLLTDIQMPIMDGFGLLKLLRNSEIRNSKTIPVAAMTAREDGNTCVYERSGFCGVLYKPYDMKELLLFLSSVHHHTKEGLSEFDFSTLSENTDDRNYMLRLVIQESKMELEEFVTANQARDYRKIRSLLHRMIPAWEMLGRDSVLRDLQELLHSSEWDEQTIHDSIHAVIEWINKLIEESNRLLDEYENLDS